MDMTVAKTILIQLGGQRFIRMTGARNLVAHPSALVFALPARAAKKGIRKVSITLNGMDTYDLDFYRVRNTKATHEEELVERRENVYDDQLQEIFTDVTGLYTRL